GSLPRVRAGYGREVSCRGRGRWAARGPAGDWPSWTLEAHRSGADGRRIRHVVLPGQAARSWAVLSAVDARAAQRKRRMAGADYSAARWRASISDSIRTPLLQAPPVAAARHRELPGRSQTR